MNFRSPPRSRIATIVPRVAGPRMVALVAVLALFERHPVQAQPEPKGADSSPAPVSPVSPAPVSPVPPRRNDVLEADRAFKEAVRRMDSGDYAAACPLLERSHALDPSSGTLLNLGDCQEHLGRTASALRAFSEARALASATGREDRAQVASARINRLAPSLRRLVILPPPGAVTSLAIWLDDVALAPGSYNLPIPVDPGEHRIRATSQEGGEVIIQAQAPESGAIAQVQLPPAARGYAGRDSAAEPERGPLDGQQIAALACGTVGVAGLISGTAFGLHSKNKHAQSDDYCTGSSCTDLRGVELMDDARRSGNLSTVSFVLGGLGLGAGAVLWFVRPFGEHQRATTQVGLAPNGIEMRGSW
jgi:hypothetical protein